MRSIDFLPQPRWWDQFRNWIGLDPLPREVERRRLIARDYGWPPVRYRGPKPLPPPAPPRPEVGYEFTGFRWQKPEPPPAFPPPEDQSMRRWKRSAPDGDTASGGWH